MQQVSQQLLRGVEFDKNIPCALLGLKGDEADTVREMQPDFGDHSGIKDHCAHSPLCTLLY